MYSDPVSISPLITAENSPTPTKDDRQLASASRVPNPGAETLLALSFIVISPRTIPSLNRNAPPAAECSQIGSLR